MNIEPGGYLFGPSVFFLSIRIYNLVDVPEAILLEDYDEKKLYSLSGLGFLYFAILNGLTAECLSGA
jgi:hypothetical protein